MSRLLCQDREIVVMLRLEGIQRRMIKLLNRVKKITVTEGLRKLGLTTLLEEMRVDLMETFKIIMEFLIMADTFSIFFFDLDIYRQDRF